MKCPKCKTENASKNKFCKECGFELQKLTIEDRMNMVKKDIPESLVKKILLTKDAIEKERKDVTVIFVDISGSTRISESLDPEELTLLMNDCFRKLSAMVYRYEGIVDKFIGDCVMAIFGAPVAHEDDPERAILACLDMQLAINEINTRLDKSLKKLNIHSGVNTGEVIAGKVGSDLQMDYTVMGDTVNVAQRLKDIATPGSIFIGPETYNRTKHAFDFISLKQMRLKGKTESVKPYEVIGKKWGSEFGLSAIRSDLIGRNKEFSKLKQGYNNLLEGRSSIFLVKGEVGVGKSRLLYEFKKFLTISTSSITLISGRGVSYERSIPFKSFADSLRHFLLAGESQVTDATDKIIKQRIESYVGDEVDEVAPYLYKLLGAELDNKQLEKIRHLDSHALQLQIFLAVATLFEKISEKKPIIFIIDDIQWADSVSLELINFVLPMVKKAKISFYLSYRVGDLSSIRKLINIIEKENKDIIVELNLKNLSLDDSAMLIDNLIGHDTVESIKDYVVKKSGGNPFFIEEIVRSIIESGMLSSKEDITEENIQIPGSIEAAISSRIDSLNRESKYLLRIASIIGSSFPMQLLEEVVEEKDILQYVNELEELEFVVKLNKDKKIFYAFRHPLFQEVAYNSLLKTERTIYHKVIAGAIEAKFTGKIDGYFATLAHHYYKCKNLEKALEYSIKAGDEAAALFANEEALTHYNRALSVAENDLSKVTIFEKIGTIKKLIGKVDEALKYFRDAQDIVENEQDRARLTRKIADVLVQTGKIDESIAILKQAKKSIEGSDTSTFIHVNYSLAFILLESKAEIKQAVELAESGIKIAKKIGDVKSEADGLRLKGQILLRTGRTEKALKVLKKCQYLYEKLKEQIDLRQLFILMAIVSCSLGHINAAIHYVKKAISIAKKIGFKRTLAICYNNLGIYYSLMGDVKSAIDYYEKSVEIREKIGDKQGVAIGYLNIGAVKEQIGQLDIALEYYNRAKGIFENINDVRWMIIIYPQIARQLLRLNKKDTAVEYYEKALRIAQEKQDRILLSVIYLDYGIYFSNIQNTKKALEYLEYARSPILEEGNKERMSQFFTTMAIVHTQNKDPQALKYAEDGLRLAVESNVKKDEVDALKTLGKVQALIEGQLHAGIRNIKRAIAMAKENSFVVQMADGFFTLGEILIANNEPTHAMKYLNQAKKIFTEVNAKFNLEKVEVLIKSIS